jgi:hypothetical protein
MAHIKSRISSCQIQPQVDSVPWRPTVFLPRKHAKSGFFSSLSVMMPTAKKRNLQKKRDKEDEKTKA